MIVSIVQYIVIVNEVINCDNKISYCSALEWHVI